jgi:patatin-like phospholipase/acyl hydrolase
MTSKKVRILCLDGGGVKGVASLRMLKDIMAEIRIQEQRTRPDQSISQSSLKPCDYFDLICGTSTGGLIALQAGICENVS